MTQTDEWILLVHAGATLCMVGLIWFVQVVHYPLMGSVGVSEFTEYEARHNQFTTWVVAPIMLVEAGTAVFLLRSSILSPSLAWIGLAALAVIWLSTFFIQVPQHTTLLNGFDESAWRTLVRSNWIRTVTWSARGGMVLWMLHSAIRRPS